MRVAFDASSAAFKHKTGTGVYTFEIINAYQNAFQNDEIYNTYRLSRAFRGREFLVKNTPNSKNHYLLDPFTAFKGKNYDIFHGLNARLPQLCNAKKIVTIHDLFSLLGDFSELKFKQDQKNKYLKTLSRADHIVVPASYTKQLLISEFNIHPSKVDVIGEGVREIFLNSDNYSNAREILKNRYNIKHPFFLFVGTLEKRKNVIAAIKAFYKFNQHSPQTHRLVLIGHPGYEYSKIEAEIINLNLQDLVLKLGFMEEEDLVMFYKCCAAFLFLSFQEGYGIPVIEAMACGVGVISSNTTSLPEVGAGHSFLIDPLDYEGIFKTMKLLTLEKTEQINNKILNGQNYARQMTWTNVARQLRQLYSRVMSQ